MDRVESTQQLQSGSTEKLGSTDEYLSVHGLMISTYARRSINGRTQKFAGYDTKILIELPGKNKQSRVTYQQPALIMVYV